MAENDEALPYGLREVGITPYTTAAATTLGTAIKYPVARTLSFEEAEEFEELRGDDKVVAIRGRGASVNWEMENGGISLPVYKNMAGGLLTTTGVTPSVVTTYKKKVTDSRPYFKAEGRSINDDGGDFHGILYKARASDTLSGEMADGAFWLTQASGQALPATLTGEEDTLYDFVMNETPAPLTFT
jgi:hypothetical protein